MVTATFAFLCHALPTRPCAATSARRDITVARCWRYDAGACTSSMASTLRHSSQSSRNNSSEAVCPTSAFSTLVHPHRDDRNAAQRQRRAFDPAVRVFFQQRRGRGDGEIAMPAREFDKAIAVTGGPARERHLGQQFVGFARRCVMKVTGNSANGTSRVPLGPATVTVASCAGGQGHKLRRRIEMAERTADRAAIARLAMADIQDRFMHDRKALSSPHRKIRYRAAASWRRIPDQPSVSRI